MHAMQKRSILRHEIHVKRHQAAAMVVTDTKAKIIKEEGRKDARSQ